MKAVWRPAILTVVMMASSACGPQSPPLAPYDVAATEAWRVQREQNLRAPDGYLAVAGLHFLRPGPNTIGTASSNDIVLPAGSGPAAVGRLVLEEGRVWLDLEPGVEAFIDDEPVRGRRELRQVDSAARRPADRLRVGRVTLHTHRSGDRIAVRVRDPEGEVLKTFPGLRWYPIDATWRVRGRFVPYDEPRKVQIQNILGDVEDAISPGEVEFVLQGTTVRLAPLRSGERLWFIFSDATGGRETYPIRFLYADAPVNGVVELDFNRAYNAPCAYNPYTTCPLPPPRNRLAVAIEAGEQLDAGHALSTRDQDR
jgi:uncharacterized protein